MRRLSIKFQQKEISKQFGGLQVMDFPLYVQGLDEYNETTLSINKNQQGKQILNKSYFLNSEICNQHCKFTILLSEPLKSDIRNRILKKFLFITEFNCEFMFCNLCVFEALIKI